MLVLFETPAGFAVFKLLDEKKLQSVENLYEDFSTAEAARKVVKLKSFEKFEDTTKALASAASLIEGKMSKDLKHFLKKIFAKDAHEKLAVADAKLGKNFTISLFETSSCYDDFDLMKKCFLVKSKLL